MKKITIFVLIALLSVTLLADWLVEVKVEGMEYEHDNALEMMLLLETIQNEVTEYQDINDYIWKTPLSDKGMYNVERWDQLRDLVVSLLHREDYNFVGIYTKRWPNGRDLIPFIYIENRFSPPDEYGTPENFVQRNFDLVKNESLLAKAFNEGQGYFTTNAIRLTESAYDQEAARDYQLKAGVRGYFAYPLKNGETTIGLLVIATKNPGLTEEQYFRIQQYGDAAVWLVVQTVDLLVNPEKVGN